MDRRVAAALALALLVSAACTDRGLGELDAEQDDGADDDDETGDPGDRPESPGSMYSVCTDTSVCTPLEFCVYPAGEAGFCSDACAGVDDASTCDLAPDGQPRAICLDIGIPDGRRVCAIDCEDGRPCPRGMRCEDVESAGQARRVCF